VEVLAPWLGNELRLGYTPSNREYSLSSTSSEVTSCQDSELAAILCGLDETVSEAFHLPLNLAKIPANSKISIVSGSSNVIVESKAIITINIKI
jgi:hypothetical protein